MSEAMERYFQEKRQDEGTSHGDQPQSDQQLKENMRKYFEKKLEEERARKEAMGNEYSVSEDNTPAMKDAMETYFK